MREMIFWVVWCGVLFVSVFTLFRLFSIVHKNNLDGRTKESQNRDDSIWSQIGFEKGEEGMKKERGEHQPKKQEEEVVEERSSGLVSTFDCQRSGDWTDLCEYTNICFDGEKIVLLYSEDYGTSRPLKKPTDGYPSFNSRWFDPGVFPPPPTNELPHSTQWPGEWRDTKTLESPYGQGSTEVYWLNASVAFMKPDVMESNLWHWGNSMFPLLDIEEMKGDKVEYVVMLRRKEHSVEWEKGVARIAMPHAKLMWEEQWNQIVKVPNNPYNKRIICASRGYMLSPKAAFFSHPRQCYEIRERAYDLYGVDRSLAHPPKPAKKVLFLQRATSRHLDNVDELKRIVESYGVEVEVKEFKGATPLEEQIGALSEVGIFVLVHGAGGSSIPFLPYHAAVIEIFPHHWAPTMYKMIAAKCNALYHLIHMEGQLSDELHWANEEQKIECEEMSRRDATKYDPCALRYKQATVKVDPLRFEEVLIDALQDIGYNLRIQERRPPQ